MQMITNERLNQYHNRLEKDINDTIDAMGTSLYLVWDVVKDFSDDFEEQTEAFFILFKELLRRGHLKLQRDDKIIEHTPEEWEQIFRAVWPRSDTPYGAYEGDICIWFTDDPCPAYAVWIDPEDGTEYWT
ncbi:DUF596 domain-containing protein [Neisseria wadsworthii]|nr:DUF596 domain-containing protein [Neisseria wadsworthii]